MRTISALLLLSSIVGSGAGCATTTTTVTTTTTKITHSRCAVPPIPGIETLAGAPIIVLGEIHGIDAAPAFTADLACQLSDTAPLTLALEIPWQEQASLDAYLSSTGQPADRATLVASPFWSGAWQDGRPSVARLDLLESIRRLRQAGAAIRVVAFDDNAMETEQAAREKAMAERLWEAHKPGETMLVLVGNLHARTVPGAPWDPHVVWMSVLLQQKEPKLLTLDNRYPTGTAWVCFSEHECGVHEMKGEGSGPRRVERFAQRSTDGYDGVYQLGPITASLPAKGVK